MGCDMGIIYSLPRKQREVEEVKRDENLAFTLRTGCRTDVPRAGVINGVKRKTENFSGRSTFSSLCGVLLSLPGTLENLFLSQIIYKQIGNQVFIKEEKKIRT